MNEAGFFVRAAKHIKSLVQGEAQSCTRYARTEHHVALNKNSSQLQKELGSKGSVLSDAQSPQGLFLRV